MSQDNGDKKNATTPFEKAVGRVEQQLGIDPDSTEDNPPQSEHQLGEDNPPQQDDYKYIPPQSGFNWKGCFITVAIGIAILLIILGVTCFVIPNIH